MSWVTVIWAMVASACLTLATMYFLVWCRNRTAWANLFFALTAAATAGLAACELQMMYARTPGQFVAIQRWAHVPVWAIIVGLVCLVRLYLHAGRPWLMWAICGLRTVSLAANFLVGQNLNLLEADRLRFIPFLSETVAIAKGTPNPWMLVGQLALVLLIIYAADATLTVWRRGDRRTALSVGGSTVLFSVLGLCEAVLVNWGFVRAPLTPSLCFLGIIVAMGYEMSCDALRSLRLAQELRDSEQRMSLAAEATGIGIWVWDVARNQVWGSEQWLALFGFAPGTAVTFEQVIQRIHPADRDMVERGVAASRVDRSDYLSDYRIALPDGGQRWVVARGRMCPAANRRPARMVGTTIDISHRKQMELALAESELRYRTLFEAAPEGILVIGADGNVVAANLAQARLYGYESPEQLEGTYAPMCVAERDRDRARQTMAELLEGRERPPRQYAAVRQDGSEFIAEVTSAILRDTGGRVQGYLCLTRDVTAATRAEAALSESLRRFRQVAEIAGEFIWEVDAEGLFTYASPSAEKMLGYAPVELVGKKHFYDLFAPSMREEQKAAAFQVFAGRQAFRGLANANVGRDGKIVYLETSGSPILGPDGSLVGYRGADTDVTARTVSQTEIAEQRNELAHLSRVTMLGELAGSLAHELNQPLAAILSNAQAAQRFLAGDNVDLNEVRDILEDIATDDQRAGEIIRRLRLLLKKGEVQQVPLDINDVVQDVLKLIRNDLLNHSIRLRTRFASGLAVIAGDRVQLQQVLLNLIMNALEAMSQVPLAEKRLLVRTEGTGEGGVRVAIVDHGTGLGLDASEKIFSPYFTTKPGGMGMGLAVCRTIITAHGGRLEGENNPGKGAVFSFTLPPVQKERP